MTYPAHLETSIRQDQNEGPSLIVEGDSFAARTLTQILEQRGFGPVVAVGPDMAEHTMARTSFALAFWSADDLDERGWAALRQMIDRQITATIVVVDEDRNIDVDAHGFITKPFDEAHVATVARSALLTLKRYSDARKYIIKLEDLLAQQNQKMTEVAERVRILEATRLALMNNTSHELKTPLTPIIGWSKIFQQKTDYTEKEVRDFANIVYTQGKRLFDVVDNLLRTASLSRERPQLSQTTLVTQDLLEQAASEAREAGRQVEIAVSTGAETISANSKLTLEVLHHLIDNAVKFSPPDAPIELSVSFDGRWILTVSDQGPGIPADQRDLVFECFYQGDSSATREFGGLGLGLFVASELVTVLGGEIWAEERFDRGTSISFSLPSDGREDSDEAENKSNPGTRRAKARVLVVDDEEDVRSLLIAVLETQGLASEAVSSVDDARSALRKQDFDVVLLDVLMPGDLALNLLRDVSTEHPNTEVIMVTGVEDPNFARTALHLGAFSYVMKPFDTREILLNIEAAIMQRERNRVERERRETLESKVTKHADVLKRTSERYRQAHRKTVIDDVTGLWNHRFLRTKMEEEASKAARLSHPLSLLVLDIDNFKSISDQYGDARSEAILTEVGGRIGSQCRSRRDALGRYGGEEFALILPETPKEGALILGERIRAAIEVSRYEVEPGESVTLTVSIGCATFPDDAISSESLFKGAERAMFQAKERGNSLVEFSAGGDPDGDFA